MEAKLDFEKEIINKFKSIVILRVQIKFNTNKGNKIIYSREEEMCEILNKKFQSVFVQNPYRDMANTCTNAKNIGNINLKKMK